MFVLSCTILLRPALALVLVMLGPMVKMVAGIVANPKPKAQVIQVHPPRSRGILGLVREMGLVAMSLLILPRRLVCRPPAGRRTGPARWEVRECASASTLLSVATKLAASLTSVPFWILPGFHVVRLTQLLPMSLHRIDNLWSGLSCLGGQPTPRQGRCRPILPRFKVVPRILHQFCYLSRARHRVNALWTCSINFCVKRLTPMVVSRRVAR